jgi:predicted DNA-binding protein (MmcQ/YjbR family)
MVLDVSQISGIGPYEIKHERDRDIYIKNQLAFLVLHRNTIEVRCDANLSENLKQKYESVMDSRYYGRGGIEVVLAGQLNQQEIEDLIRLSYNMTQ